MGRLWVGLALLLTAAAGGVVNEEVLIFRNFARSANDAKFRAETALFLASISLERAKYQLELVRSLQPSKASSFFEYSDAIITLQRANFSYERTRAEIIEAEANEKIWTIHAKSLERGGDNAKAIARLNVDLREKQLGVARNFYDFAKPTVAELLEQYQRMKRMVAAGAVAVEEFKRFEILATKAEQFLPAIRRNVDRARQRLVEAKAEARPFGE